MHSVGRLPKQVAECKEVAPTSASEPKSLWWRNPSSPQRVSLPARIVLVVLLCAQIVFLAIVRLGPSTSIWGGKGTGSFVQASSKAHPINSIAIYGSPVESHALANEQSKASMEPSSSSPNKGTHRKKKSTSKQKKTAKKMLMNGNMPAETRKANNVAQLTRQKGSGDSAQVSVSSVSAKEPMYGETSSSRMKKAPTRSRVGHKHDKNLSKIKQVVTKTEAQTWQENDKSDGSVSKEKLKEAAIAISVEFHATKQEARTVVGEEASKAAISMVKVAKQQQGIRDSEKERQAPSAEEVEGAADDASKEGNGAKQEAQSILATEEAHESASSLAKAAEKLQSVKELQAASKEKESKRGVVKEEVVLVEQKVFEGMSSSECSYGYIYVYELPPTFNRDIISNCTALNPWFDLCPRLSNGGLGVSLGKASPLGQEGSWYASDLFTTEIVFHNRILQHACLTDKLEIASAFYVPFYAGLDVGRYLFAGASIENRDRLGNQFAEWLIEQPAWKKSGGADHVMMIGRVTWDFRRSKDEDWGSGFFNKPAIQNITKLLVERNPWDSKEMGVPYLTNFHPQSDVDLTAWQNHIRGLERENLFAFVGAPRDRFPDDFRGILFAQCDQTKQCQSLDCSKGACDNNQKTLEVFMDSRFCLQPRGGSFTRRSTFDCLLAGSIPVFFWHRSAYMQYEWHLPTDEGSYSVFISKQDVRNGTKIEDVLKAIAPEMVKAMQEAVIQLIPKVVYAVSGFALKEKDAFDVAIEGVMRSLKGPNLSAH